MLILQRRVGERVVVDGVVEITVTSVTRNAVRLAVNAPAGVTVVRGEVHDVVAEENARAAGASQGVEWEVVTELEGELSDDSVWNALR